MKLFLKELNGFDDEQSKVPVKKGNTIEINFSTPTTTDSVLQKLREVQSHENQNKPIDSGPNNIDPLASYAAEQLDNAKSPEQRAPSSDKIDLPPPAKPPELKITTKSKTNVNATICHSLFMACTHTHRHALLILD